MATTKRKAPADKDDKVYFDLVRKFPLRPIRSEEELAAATEVMQDLAIRDDLTLGEQDYLDILTNIIEAYEDVHYPMNEVSGLEILRHLIEESGKPQFEIAREVKIAASTISSILNGTRELNRKHIEAFAAYFRLSPEAFMAKRHPETV